ncbi:MgtC/SapB family protein [Myxococcus llanfairpwllgwyngyllgogerychwyrndrobwllllantysiliogogogochensis]|uniref:MgtC/SapB family protein n=1 Tax=Myxococcus llanfairpwllgwyngyllgogerychwyrndrobwllllantysiliogogogochensis TaxID=2590453 RepID=A0A540WQ32_9BACT|nr:MgtC/SapB family protein [Myxococcus llanfairpwllgwyngyllgogerychwyrndrobwllllantysiliogogogochensis]TQF11128.1 MgtC/SapB family protein [Myxococcus llanfairpwllgwyngyllgogerychwyrndrobwllllantysiliogogogochensis]
MDETLIALRLGVAALLGAVLGLERELRGQAAGLRTHILVSLGACLFTLASVFVEWTLGGDSPDGSRADVSRIASQVVVGIGFLGAGAIIRDQGQVKGLTTAANLWLTASVGLATGMGFHWAAGTTVVIALLALAGLRPLERAIRRHRVRKGLKVEGGVSAHPDEEGPD